MAQKNNSATAKDPGRRKEYGLTGINILEDDKQLLYQLIAEHRKKHGVKPRQFEMLGIIIKFYLNANS